MDDIVLAGQTNPQCSFDGCEKRAIAHIKNAPYPFACVDHFDDQMRLAGEQVNRLVTEVFNRGG